MHTGQSACVAVHPSNWSAVRSVFHGQVPCGLKKDGVIETSSGEENGGYALGNNILEHHRITQNIFHRSCDYQQLGRFEFWYRCWVGGYGSGRCCINNKFGCGHISAFQLRNYLCSSSLDEIDTQDPYHSIDFLQPLFYQVLPVLASHDLSSICFLIDAITQQAILCTLVDLSTNYLRLLFQPHCCLQTKSQLNNGLLRLPTLHT